MTSYHGSSVKGLITLKPFVSEHEKPYIYFSSNPVIALLYTIHPVEKPFSWYPYGFDENGTVIYTEYYPDAFADVYKDKVGYLYECDDIQNVENPTNILWSYTYTEPIKVDRVLEIEDVYQKFMEYKSKGLFRIKQYEELSSKELAYIQKYFRNLIAEHDLINKPYLGMSKFIRQKFSDIWLECMTIFHYDSLIDENNDPAHDPPLLRDYMDRWDGQAFVDELLLTADKTVLEIGVGTGRLALKVCGNCKSFTGIDISPKTIERTIENLQAFGNTTLLCADFMDYPFACEFDVIYSSLTFMHIKDKQTAINKIAKLLTSNGRVVLSIDKNQSRTLDFGSRQIELFPDTVEAITNALKSAGLSIAKQFDTQFATIIVALRSGQHVN